jgi:hypothetical protein
VLSLSQTTWGYVSDEFVKSEIGERAWVEPNLFVHTLPLLFDQINSLFEIYLTPPKRVVFYLRNLGKIFAVSIFRHNRASFGKEPDYIWVLDSHQHSQPKWVNKTAFLVRQS